MLLVTVAALLAVQDAAQPKLRPLNRPEWITADDYPASALRNNEEGVVKFKLTVAGDGSVAHCDITASSGFADLDVATCTLIAQRARFKAPKPNMPYYGSVGWKIPEVEPQPIAWVHAAAIIGISANDEILGCEEKTEGTVTEAIGKPCHGIAGPVPAEMLVALGGAGKPRTITLEYGSWFGGEAEPANLYSRPGQVTLGHRRFRFDIAQSGKIENCQEIATGQEGILVHMPSLCENGLGPFSPPVDAAGRPRVTTGMVDVAFSRTP